jgi:ubiquinone/menaquinone biosynthesis C-methylase UbiE
MSPADDPALPERYTAGYEDNLIGWFSERSMGREGAFFLPYLAEGMRVLDVGCGPGSLSLDLAARVGPEGRVLGVDIEGEQFARGAAAAAERGIENVSFQTGSVYELDVTAGSFDAVFAHAVLYHLARPAAALGELHRVLAPGGIVGLRDSDFGGDLCEPCPPGLEAAWELGRRVLSHHGADVGFGRKHRRLLSQAGFEVLSVSATYDVFSLGGGAEAFAEFWIGYLGTQHRDRIHAAGWASSEEVDDACSALADWARSPGAMYARARCEAVARKP